MTDEERIAALEKTVRGFNLTTNQPSSIGGGFGELAKGASIEERLANLEKAHEDFRIIGGNNVTVEGSLKTGFAVCATCPQDQGVGGVPIPTPFPAPVGCPTSITFSGIEFCCACQVLDVFPMIFHEEVIAGFDYHLNGTFSLSGGTGIECDPCFNDSDSFLIDQISENTDCPTGSETSVPVPILIYVAQISGVFYVLAYSGFFDEIFFSGSGAGTTISNDLTACNFPSPDTFDNPLIECIFSSPIDKCAAGKNGTATLNF